MMKKILLSILLAASIGALQAQPVLESGHMPLIGSHGTVSQAAASIAPGNGGASQNWDFSTLSTMEVGTYRVITPDSTPYFSTFPLANFSLQLTPTGSTASLYEYDHVTTDVWEELATNYSPGSGDNYTSNPETVLPFPFHYSDTHVDTFIKTTGGPYAVTITYDGYGTVKTPYGTFPNVARVKYYWGPGDFSYHWISTNPIFPIITYSSQENRYTLAGNVETGIREEQAPQEQVLAYPNPFIKNVTLSLGSHIKQACTLEIMNTIGQVMLTQTVIAGADKIVMQRGNLPAGIYFYRLQSTMGVLATGTLAAE